VPKPSKRLTRGLREFRFSTRDAPASIPVRLRDWRVHNRRGAAPRTPEGNLREPTTSEAAARGWGLALCAARRALHFDGRATRALLPRAPRRIRLGSAAP